MTRRAAFCGIASALIATCLVISLVTSPSGGAGRPVAVADGNPSPAVAVSSSSDSNLRPITIRQAGNDPAGLPGENALQATSIATDARADSDGPLDPEPPGETTAGHFAILSSNDPNISLQEPEHNQVFGFNQTIFLDGSVFWPEPVGCGGCCCPPFDVTVTMRLICPRDCRQIDEDVFMGYLASGEQHLNDGCGFQGALSTPDGSDPNDTGNFCIIVIVSGDGVPGGTEEFQVKVELGGGCCRE